MATSHVLAHRHSRPAHPAEWRHTGGLLRHSRADGALVALSLVYGIVLSWKPSVPLIAVGLWWTANTVAHNFIHLPFFRTRVLNGVYSAYLSLLMGVPQSLWRSRHLAHHADRPHRIRWTWRLSIESGLIVTLWTGLAWWAPRGFFLTYLPGWGLGLAICQLQGYFEHARGTTSHYGRLYNALFFNDGYHVEHHAHPSTHWAALRRHRCDGANASRWPPAVRWLDRINLDGLECLVARSRLLQRMVLRPHARAFATLLPHFADARRVTVVGGGLFPRTALVLHTLLPRAHVTLLDMQADHLDLARAFLGDRVTYRVGRFDPRQASDADMVVVPLAYVGDRRAVYDSPAAPCVIVHDWLWARRPQGRVVAWWLLKRVNLVTAASARPLAPPLA